MRYRILQSKAGSQFIESTDQWNSDSCNKQAAALERKQSTFWELRHWNSRVCASTHRMWDQKHLFVLYLVYSKYWHPLQFNPAGTVVVSLCRKLFQFKQHSSDWWLKLCPNRKFYYIQDPYSEACYCLFKKAYKLYIWSSVSNCFSLWTCPFCLHRVRSQRSEQLLRPPRFSEQAAGRWLRPLHTPPRDSASHLPDTHKHTSLFRESAPLFENHFLSDQITLNTWAHVICPKGWSVVD